MALMGQQGSSAPGTVTQLCEKSQLVILAVIKKSFISPVLLTVPSSRSSSRTLSPD